MCAQSAQAGGRMMIWEDFIDTLLNVTVFVFIGLLMWLYFRKEPTEEGSLRPASRFAKESD